MNLTLEKAKEINATMVTEDHLLLHAANVSAAMEAMADHFGEDREHWAAVGWLPTAIPSAPTSSRKRTWKRAFSPWTS